MQNKIFISFFCFLCVVLGCSSEEKKRTTVKEFYSQISTQLYTEGNIEQVKKLLAEADAQFESDKQWAKLSARFRNDASVIGKSAPEALEVSWLANKANIDTQSGTLLIIFWELWCPHCRNEVPALETLYQEFQPKGLQMVGLTRMSRDISTANVKDFIKEEKISYPMAKTGTAAGKYFSVSGIPAAVVLNHGKVVWKGNPKALPHSKLTDWLSN